MALKLYARLWLHQATTEASVKTPQEMRLGVAMNIVLVSIRFEPRETSICLSLETQTKLKCMGLRVDPWDTATGPTQSPRCRV